MNEKAIDLKLYLDGLNVPIESVTVSGRIGGPSLASISVIPHRILERDIIARMYSNVFFRYMGEDDFNLLFEGDALGYSDSAEPQKSMAFNLADEANFLSGTILWFLRQFATPGAGSDQSGWSADPSGSEKFFDFTTNVYGDPFIIETGSKLEVIKKVVESLPTINAFFKNAENRVKITKRYKFFVDNYIEGIAQSEYFQQRFIDVMKSLSDYSNTIMDAVNGLLSVMEYMTSSNPIPFYEDGNIYNMIMHPDFAFTAPPMCNVVFPTMWRQYLGSRNYNQEATRVVMYCPTYATQNIPLNWQQSQNQFIVAPDILDKEIDSIRNGVLDAVTGGALDAQSSFPLEGFGGDKAFDISNLTNEEIFKGVIRQDVRKAMMFIYDKMNASGYKEDFIDTYIRNLANYYYLTERIANRTLSIVTDFNPNLVAGLPVLLLDPITPKFGRLVSYEHTIGRNGAVTRMTCSHVRPIEDLYLDVMPPIFSREWDPGLIGEKVYQPLLGCPSIFDFTGKTNMKDAAEYLLMEYNKYRDSYDPLASVRKYMKRRMIKLREFYTYLGAWDETNQVPNPDAAAFATISLNGNNFFDRQNAISEYKVAIQGGVFIG